MAGLKLLVNLLRVQSRLNKRPVARYQSRVQASALHIRRSPSKTDRLSAGIGQYTQGEQIAETEGSFDLEPVVGFQPDADCECRRGKAL
jgi:hypothetical protein